MKQAVFEEISRLVMSLGCLL